MNKGKSILRLLVLSAFMGIGIQTYAADYSMDTVYVDSDKNQKALGVLAYQTQNIGLLGNRDALDTPFSSMTLSKKSFQYYASPSAGAADVLALNPAVRSSASSLYNDISIRGFRITGHGMYINGIPGLLDQQHLTDVFVDSVSVIAGPNLGIAGTPITQSEGGTVEFQSKRAQSQPNTDLTLSYQGGKSFREILDAGRRFGQDQRYGIRVMADHIGGETSVKHEKLTQNNVFINLDQRTTYSKTNLLVGYDETDQKAGPYSFSFGNNVTYMPKAPKASRNYKPDWSYNKFYNWIAALNHEQKLSDHATAFINAGYHRENWYGYIDGSPTINDNQGNYTIGLTNYPLALTKKYVGMGIKGHFRIGSSEHDYVINLDKNWYNYWLSKDTDFGTNGTYTISGNLYTDNWWPSPVLTHGKPVKSQDMQMTGWHIADTVSFLNNKVQVLAGIHGQRAEQTKAGSSTKKYDGINPTFAVNYKWTPDFSSYISHSENFNVGTMVGSGYANYGELLDPTKTKQNEFGFKYKNGRILHTLSFFRIKQANYNNVTIDGELYYKAYGEQTDKGIEYTAAGTLSDKMDFVGGFQYMNARQALTGKAVNGAAKWSATAAVIYHSSEKLSLIGRAQYMGRAPINNEALTVPSHFIFDAGASYDTDFGRTPVTLKAMIYNLTNRNYWLASAGRSAVLLGAPRTLVLSAAFHF